MGGLSSKWCAFLTNLRIYVGFRWNTIFCADSSHNAVPVQLTVCEYATAYIKNCSFVHCFFTLSFSSLFPRRKLLTITSAIFLNNYDKLSPFLIKLSEERYFDSKGEFSHTFSFSSLYLVLPTSWSESKVYSH